MFVNSAPFMVTYSRRIRFQMVKFIPNRTVATLIGALKKVINLYARGGYTINLIMMDRKKEKLPHSTPHESQPVLEELCRVKLMKYSALVLL